MFAEARSVRPLPYATDARWLQLGWLRTGPSRTACVVDPKPVINVAFLLIDDEAKSLKIQVLDPQTDAELYPSPTDIPVRLGV